MSNRFTKIEKGQVALTTFFLPGSQRKASESRRVVEKPAHRHNVNATLGELSTRKTVKNHNDAPALSPQITPPMQRRKLSALHSETNLTTVGGTSDSHCKDRKVGRHDTVIDLTDSPVAKRTIMYGLPTPVTAVKNRAPPATDSALAPTCAPGGRSSSPTDSSDPNIATPLPRLATLVEQQATPSTPPRPRSLHALPQSLFSPISPKKLSRREQPHCLPSSAKSSVVSSGSQEIIPSSQTQNDNPFNPFDVHGEGETTKDSTLFKIPDLPTHHEANYKDRSREMSNTHAVSSHRKSRALTLPISGNSRTMSSSTNSVVPTSQAHEDELVFFSPGRSGNSSNSLIVPASQLEEEELVLPGLCSTPKNTHRKRKLDDILPSPSRSRIQSSIPTPLGKIRQGSSLALFPSPSSHPSTPKRKRIVPDLPEPARSRTSSPGKDEAAARSRIQATNLTADSGVGTSLSPERPFDDSQTQPESPRWATQTPRRAQLQSSQTQPESPQWLLKSPAATASRIPPSPQRVAKTQRSPQSSQTEPESSQWVAKSPPLAPLVLHSSQTEPESSQWLVSPSQLRTRARAGLPLADEDDSADAEPASLPIADYESQGPAEPEAGSQHSDDAPPSAGSQDSQSQPWNPSTQERRDLSRRLRYIRTRPSKEWDELSDGPLSLPTDIGESQDIGALNTQDLLASPVREFLGLR